jgi:hypothetical protein
MKHHLFSFRLSPWLSVACLLILTLLCASATMAASSAALVGLLVAAGSAFLCAGLGGMVLLRNAASADGSDNGGGDAPIDPAAAIAAIEDKTLPMSQRLSVALKALQGIAPAEQLPAKKCQSGNSKAL